MSTEETPTDLTIRHTYADGTVLDGDPRPHHQILKDVRWRYSRNVGTGGGWYVRGSRDKILDPYTVRDLHTLADRLRTVGFTVDVEVDNTPRAAADVEADKVDRADARRTALTAKAARLDTEAAGIYDAARTMGDAIPFGQPLLVDHYSYKRDRNYRARMVAKYDKAFSMMADARETARRAAWVGDPRNESIGTVMRRIDTLAAELRDLERKVDADWFAGQSEEWRDYILLKLTEVTGKLDHWEQVLVDREAAGEKVFRQADLKPGDQVRSSWGWGIVIKPNKKTVKVQWRVDGFAYNTEYSKIIDHRPAVEVTADAS